MPGPGRARLPEPVDVVFSNATFHWIADHDALFAALHRNMKPGARLLAQCGGRGNIDSFRRAPTRSPREEPFAPYFADWRRPWNYATAEETEQRLREQASRRSRAGRGQARRSRGPRALRQTVCLVRHLDPLPEELREQFIDRVLERCAAPFALEYVRLNMVASAAR